MKNDLLYMCTEQFSREYFYLVRATFYTKSNISIHIDVIAKYTARNKTDK